MGGIVLKLKKMKVGKGRYGYAPCKRAFDFLAAAIFLLVLAPLFFCIAFAIRVSSPGPVFFCQVRMGRSLEPFLLYKFRTMTVSAPRDCATAELCEPARYITRIGAFLRKTSLDELPQLYNILRGEMSFLGPRPVVLGEEELILRRLFCGAYRVRPGMSGLSQVRGRDLLSCEDKAALDGKYAERLSLALDLFLVFSTAFAVLARRHIREGRLGESH